MSENAKAPKRTAAEIEADLARIRGELTSTVNLLTERLSPRTQLENAKEAALDAADRLTDKAATLLETAGDAAFAFAKDTGTTAKRAAADAKEMTRTFVGEVQVKAKALADDAVEGDPKALALITGAVAAVGAVVVGAILRRGR